MEQRTEEWFAARCGLVTASRVADVCARTKSGWGASRANYQAQIIAERLTGQVAESFSSAAMHWGTDTEPQARAAYCFLNDVDVKEVGFAPHPTIKMSGASPDGLVGETGLVEIKCPNTATQIAKIIKGEVTAKYITQMQWQMACTGREWCDFFSFDPRLPMDAGQYWLRRVHADKERIAELETLVAEFLAETDDKIKSLKDALNDQY